jgi:DNA-directed RNA polymerase specialized sigma24 family protein
MVIAPSASNTDPVSAAIAGDEAAFDALVGPSHRDRLQAGRSDGEEARDAVQEACFTAWRKLHRSLTAAAICAAVVTPVAWVVAVFVEWRFSFALGAG